MDELELAIDNCMVSFDIDEKYEKNTTEGHIFRKLWKRSVLSLI
tara:strand:+ start:496 stop:627 length:132 start_codon:yes stop_codon:yes gene_type:complete